MPYTLFFIFYPQRKEVSILNSFDSTFIWTYYIFYILSFVFAKGSNRRAQIDLRRMNQGKPPLIYLSKGVTAATRISRIFFFFWGPASYLLISRSLAIYDFFLAPFGISIPESITLLPWEYMYIIYFIIGYSLFGYFSYHSYYTEKYCTGLYEWDKMPSVNLKGEIIDNPRNKTISRHRAGGEFSNFEQNIDGFFEKEWEDGTFI